MLSFRLPRRALTTIAFILAATACGSSAPSGSGSQHEPRNEPDADGGPSPATPPNGPAEPDAAARADVPSVPRPDATSAADAPPRADAAASDAFARDVAPGPDGGHVSCSRTTCGGDPRGLWEIVGYCSASDGAGTGMGTLSIDPDGTYAFLLLSSTLPRQESKPTPEKGTWRLENDKLVLKTTQSNGAVFSPRGAFVYRGDKGATVALCVTGDSLVVRAEDKNPFNWAFRRPR